ncbi:MAG TPA: hypothetical protein VFM49_20195 [Chloroflexia bacterium]|jgi:hypothetical protein|nr:hypothetical protein [Chloroflexia bacterium]
MAKVFSIHDIELHSGVDPAEFERFIAESSYPDMPGTKTYYVKGYRGERAGKYAILLETESIERLLQLFPTEAWFSEEARQYFESEALQRHFARWGQLGTGPGAIYTDYVVIK